MRRLCAASTAGRRSARHPTSPWRAVPVAAAAEKRRKSRLDIPIAAGILRTARREIAPGVAARGSAPYPPRAEDETMRSALLFAALAAIAIAFAWSVEAEDAEPGAAPRLDAIEARLAAVEKRLRALEGSTAREEPRAPGPAPAAQGAQGRDALRATRISVSFEDESAVRVLRIVADYAKVSLVV